MKKVFALILAVMMVAACFAGCQTPNNATADQAGTQGGASAMDATGTESTGSQDSAASDLKYIQDKGTFIVGITDYAPMDYKDDSGNWTGFDAEFAELVGKELGVTVEFFELADWESKFFELDAKNIDCIWNGMTITDEVLKNTSCSDPYVKNAQVVVMKADAAANYTDADSIKDLTFAVEKSSAGASALDDLGITGYIETTDQAGALMEVAAGTAQATVIDITMANAMTGEGTGYADLAQAMELTSEEYGIGFRTGSDVTVKVNELMAKWMADGTLDALAAKYELTLIK